MDEFKIGSVYYTMDVTLTQDGYYNPRAVAGRKQREYFIEGVDYFNSTDYPHTLTPGVPLIDWAKWNAPTPTSDYHSPDYQTFAQLSDIQRNAVIRTLGYLPLFDFSYSNARKKQTIEGNPSDLPWTPDWAGKPAVIEYVQVAGWTDKYIRMPQGAVRGCAASRFAGRAGGGNREGRQLSRSGQNAVYSGQIDSRGDVGRCAGAIPESRRSTFTATLCMTTTTSPAHWQVDYVGEGNGARLFTLNDGVTNAAHGRDPNWYWQSTTREENVYDVPIADAAAVPGTSGTGRYISVPDGYRSTLASVTGT
jgi:hypothetical protein